MKPSNPIEPQIRKHFFDVVLLIRSRMMDVVQDTDAGLPSLQIVILRILAECGEISQSQLVEKVGRDKSQVTRLVNDLEKKSFLTKKRNEKDRRGFILKLAEGIEEKFSFFHQYEEALVTKMLTGISKTDLKKLDELLVQMQDNLNT